MCCKKYIFVALIGLVACHPVRHHYIAQKTSTAGPDTDQSASYVFRITTADTSKASTISLLNKSLATGVVKSHNDPTLFPSRLIVTQQDAAASSLDVITFEHPLFKTTEYITDQLMLNRKVSTANVAEFLVRLPLRPSATTLQIEEFSQNRSLGKTYFELK